MAEKKLNIIGKLYGLWTVIAESNHKNRSGYFWLCKCLCGNEKLVSGSSLRNGSSQSCGCKESEKINKFKFFSKNFIVKENGCWEWRKCRDANGYAKFCGGKAHRYSYEHYKGKIPKNISVCHNCPGGDNRGCVNPEHLWLGTCLENNRDKKFKGTQLRGEKIGTSKLTECQVKEIKLRYSKGEKGNHLAKEFNVSHGLVYHILNGRAWSHIK